MMLGKFRKLFKAAELPAPVYDPVLGSIVFNVDESLWEACLSTRDDPLRIRVAGEGAPDAKLLEHARAVAADEDGFRKLISAFLNAEAPKFESDEVEVRSLRIESLNLVWPERPDDGMVYFEGGHEDRVWRCDYISRKPVGLGFDD